ncbi:MAG: DHHA1 domain-containing protein [bacterium]|nr:DHHA1 domain-containing protein [bacterium]
MKNSSFKEIEKIISKAKRILVATHQGPDGDAIGSLAAFGLYLKKIGKICYLLSVSGVPEYLKFIPGAKLIKSKHPKNKYDLVVGLDYGQKNRLGLDRYFEKYPETPILVFDHHPTSGQNGNFGIIDSHYSSTTELLYDYFGVIKFNIDKKIAYALSVGILSDTGFFKYTDKPRPLGIIASMMKRFKIKPVEIDNALNGHTKLVAFKLAGKIQSRAEYRPKEDFIFSWVKRRELIKHRLNIDDLGNIEQILNLLEDGRFALFLIEEDTGRIRGRLRSRPDKNFNVAKLAEKINGGGHKYAAGFRCKGTIDSTLKLVAKYAKK